MSSDRVWGPVDRTGGPVDQLIDHARAVFPDLSVRRLVGTHRADDDNIYWLCRGAVEVQLDTGEGGDGPFVVEADRLDSRLDTPNPVQAWLHLEALLSRI